MAILFQMIAILGLDAENLRPGTFESVVKMVKMTAQKQLIKMFKIAKIGTSEKNGSYDPKF